jgi:5-formyltetrahydrofolate cyclo-ligase
MPPMPWPRPSPAGSSASSVPSPPVDPRKAELRAHYRQLRRAHAAPLQQLLDHGAGGLLEQLLAAIGIQPQQHVGLAWPLPGEPDLRRWLQASGRPLALPAVAAQQLRYRPWRADQPLVPDACGIPAPPSGAGELAAAQLGLLLIPALAMDRQGVRLGYGGGWYDRLRQDPAWRRVPALAVLPQACIAPQLPRDPWDVPLDGWLSEQGWHQLTPAQ